MAGELGGSCGTGGGRRQREVSASASRGRRALGGPEMSWLLEIHIGESGVVQRPRLWTEQEGKGAGPRIFGSCGIWGQVKGEEPSMEA